MSEPEIPTLTPYEERLQWTCETLCEGKRTHEILDEFMGHFGLGKQTARQFLREAREVLRLRVLHSEPQSAHKLAQDFYAIHQLSLDAGDRRSAIESLKQYRETMVNFGGNADHNPHDVLRSLCALLREHVNDWTADDIEEMQDALTLVKHRRAPASRRSERRTFKLQLAASLAGAPLDGHA